LPGELVSIKGTPEGLIILLDSNHELEEIKKHLQQKMEAAKGFFKGANFTIYQQQRDIPPVARRELEAICQRYGLIPSSKIKVPYTIKARQKKESQQGQKVYPFPNQPGMLGNQALLHPQSLRSGQSLSYSGHIVVVGNVHPGAEIVAGGNVAVMGTCCGSVHAGVHGNKSARIIAFRLIPSVLSIAGVPARSASHNLEPAFYPEVAYLRGDKIIVERYRHTLKTTSQ